MSEELSEKEIEQKDDSKDMVVIKYYDRINRQWIDVEVTKEVARFMESNRKNRKRSQDKFEHYTKQFDKVFVPSKPNNERFLSDPSADYDTIKENERKEKFEEFEIEHNRVLIENSLDCLTPEQREVVELVLQNFSYSEIAEKLNLENKQIVTNRMRRAKKRLRKFIKDTEN